MTAVPDWDVAEPRASDAELVRGSLAGDRAAFADIYDRYADRLYDFCVGMLRDRDGAADCVQDTFCIAATRLHQLREPDRLRPWLYSVARHEALRRLRDRRRETPSDALPELESADEAPDALSARTELADLVADVAGGLSDRDQAVLDLAFRHGLNGPDLAEALGVSHSNANTMVQRLKRTIERSLGALLVSRRAHHREDACAQLREILAGWDGTFTILLRKRVTRHIESCDVCEQERKGLVSPAALLGAPIFIPAPAELRERTLGEVQLTSHGSAMADTPGPGKGPEKRRPSRALVAALLISLLGVSGALLLGSLLGEPVELAPVEVGDTEPGPTGPPAAPVGPPPAAPPSQPGTPRNAPPPSGAPPQQTPPPASQTPPALPAPVDTEPAPEEPVPDAPAEEPPMSFTPSVVAPPPPGPDVGGDEGGDSRRRR
ncbi:RNA polymerase sigma factor [Mycolicibacterium sp. XJ1819]